MHFFQTAEAFDDDIDDEGNYRPDPVQEDLELEEEEEAANEDEGQATFNRNETTTIRAMAIADMESENGCTISRSEAKTAGTLFPKVFIMIHKWI